MPDAIATTSLPSYRLLGIRLNALTIPEVTEQIEKAITENGRCVFGTLNLHGIYVWDHDPGIKAFYAMADPVWADGMALMLLARLRGIPLQRKHRITFLDLLHPLCQAAEQRGWRIFYLGSKPGVAQRGAEILRRQYPRLCIEAAHGYFDAAHDSPENEDLLRKLKAYRPHILMVGMGQPRQENWIVENLDSLVANAVLAPGACMDYVAGVIPTPPRWMGQIGLEWLFRLASEPRRLWHRYLVEPWYVLGLYLRDSWLGRRPLADAKNEPQPAETIGSGRVRANRLQRYD